MSWRRFHAAKLSGGKGNDTLTDGAGTDAMYGEAGNDTLWGRDGGNDFFDGGADTDTAEPDLLPLDPPTSIFNVEVVNRA